MKSLLLFLMLILTWSLVSIGTASADLADLGAVRPAKPAPGGAYEGGWRTGGDTVVDATPISALPFTDIASTCGFADNYDWMCPFGGGIGPDVVYRYEPLVDEEVDIDLCASLYDTKVFVFEDVAFNVIACNDDAGCGYSGYQSRILGLSLPAGHVYYIVVDAYGSDCGEYTLVITPHEPCELECPAGAQQEGEPPCADGYYDTYNGGCHTNTWTSISDQGGGCATLCGRSCTYLYQGMSYRDTDWYAAEAAGGDVTTTCTAEFPLQHILIYGTNCANLEYVFDAAAECETTSLSWSFAAGEELWIWVGASVFEGIPESDYVLEVCGLATDEPSAACCLPSGICVVVPETECSAAEGDWLWPLTSCVPDPCTPTPVEETSWGKIKARYR